jgi:hypothetical protein
VSLRVADATARVPPFLGGRNSLGRIGIAIVIGIGVAVVAVYK